MSIDARQTYRQQVVDLETGVVRTAARVCEAITRATEAFLEGSHDLAADVQAGDVLVDAGCRDAEERIYEIIACQQPMASDLRALLTVLRLLHELARSGDLARNIAGASAYVPPHELTPPLRGLISRMGTEARRLFVVAVDAWIDRDPRAAADLHLLDEQLDRLHNELIAELYTARLPVRSTVQLALVARYYERFGDHAVAIGDRVRHLIAGT